MGEEVGLGFSKMVSNDAKTLTPSKDQNISSTWMFVGGHSHGKTFL